MKNNAQQSYINQQKRAQRLAAQSAKALREEKQESPQSGVTSIQWFPGHMAKTRRLMRENLKLVDIIIELTDARIPMSSRNPEIDELIGTKPRLVLLNKCDAADEKMNQAWCGYYKKRNIPVLAADCRSGKGLGRLMPMVREILAEVITRWESKGMGTRSIRMMVVGVPNVGKSSFINRMANSRRTKVEDRPGVTRGKQWVKLENGLELLDMPGVLWPKFEDKQVGENLAFTGAVKDDVLDIQLLAMRLLSRLKKDYPALLCQRYAIAPEELAEPDQLALLELVGRKRGMLLGGGEIDTQRAAITVLDEFRSGRIGRITLESCDEFV